MNSVNIFFICIALISILSLILILLFSNDYLSILIYLFFNVIIIIGFLIFLFINKKNKNNIKVLEHKENFEEAKDIIINVNENLNKLITFINNKYKNVDSDLILNKNKKKFIKNILKDINKNYNDYVISEHFPEKENVQTSYNVNKGESIHLCLRNYINSKFHDFNSIMFVALHELSHCCNHTSGHKKDFWAIFRFLLENAAEINIYTPINYKEHTFTYCSTFVKYNPMFDESLNDNVYFI